MKSEARIKIAQFGEGNFLRSFSDLYFDTLNREGGNYGVNIIKPIPNGSLESFKLQNNKYHVVLRGVKDGQAREEALEVSSVDEVISPFDDPERYYALAEDPALVLVVSNTTEAGITFDGSDKFDDFSGITFPAKLTKFLYKRFSSGLGGLYILPVELIENNADELYRCVDAYIKLWALPEEFKIWNDRENYYCNTLVDRIVSGYPRDEAARKHIFELIGKEDALVSVAEPFGLWAVEKKGEIDKYIKEGSHNIDVVLTNDIGYYKKRKVRVLNGSHTNLVAAGLIQGKSTVAECMLDPDLHGFFKSALDEIIPFVSSNTEMTRRFAADVEERFFNPHLNHRLSDIALNSISKWRARNLPAFRDYYNKNGRTPKALTVGFSYLMYLYKTRYDELHDNKEYLDFFREERSVSEFMRDEKVWGEDLAAYKGFLEAVEENIARLGRGEKLL